MEPAAGRPMTILIRGRYLMPLKPALRSLLLLTAAASQAQASPPSPAVPSLSGRWLVTADMHGISVYVPMELLQQQGKISGTYDGQPLHGELKGGSLSFVAEDDTGGETVAATWAKGVLSGTIVDYDNADKEHPDRYAFKAEMIPEARRPNAGRRHELVPSVFYREFSPLNKPVLSVAPGDTIHTTTIDAVGADETGMRRILGGNPQTGPFYVESAIPGDTLVVHLTRVRLNRDYALSDDAIVSRGLDSSLARKMNDSVK